VRRYARTAAALFGLVTGLIGLAQLGASLAVASGLALALLPLILLSATSSGLLALGSGAVLALGDRARLGGRVAGVLLAGTVLGYVPLVVLSSPGVLVGAIVPALAAVILFVTTREHAATRDLAGLTPAGRIGRLLLLGVGAAALVWSAVQLAGMTADGSISGLGGYAGARAGISLASLHVALAVVAARFPGGALIAAGALDVLLGMSAFPVHVVSAIGGLVLVGLLLLGLGVGTARGLYAQRYK
jgi:hypothetical protein